MVEERKYKKNIIMKHYDKKRSFSRDKREQLTTIIIRKINNFIKSILFKKYTKNKKVLDLGCGKGGDLTKIKHSGVVEYLGIDISSKSIEEAENRIKYILKDEETNIKVHFKVGDVFNEKLEIDRKFEVISCQFSLHYCFINEESFKITIDNIDDYLEDNGYVILTIPDREKILNEGSNRYYKIDFINKEEKYNKTFGNEYKFYLKDAIDNCIEYLVDDNLLIKTFEDKNYSIEENCNFLNFLLKNYKDYEGIGKRFTVNKRIDQEEKEVISLYKVVVLKKCKLI